MKFELSIIIPTKDRGVIFEQTFNAALSAVANRNAEIIIINDSDVPLKGLDVPAKVHVLQNIGKGVATARNYGAKKASAELLLFLDDDILINETSLNQLLDHFYRDPKNIYISNWIYPNLLNDQLNKTSFGRFMLKYKLNSLKGWLNFDSWSDIKLMEIKNGASFCLLIDKVKFYSIDGYNEKFPYAGAEDYDFCERLKSKGVRFYVDPNVMVFHNELDRVSLNGWLNRKKRDSTTKGLAFKLGYSEFEVRYSRFRSFFLTGVYKFRAALFAVIKLVPNIKLCDGIYFKLVGLLCAGYIHKGYKEI